MLSPHQIVNNPNVSADLDKVTTLNVIVVQVFAGMRRQLSGAQAPATFLEFL